MCGFCKSYDMLDACQDGIGSRVQQAVSNPLNPREKGAGLLQYASPVVATSQEREQALSILNDLNSSYREALQQNHGDTQLIQKNKLTGSIASQLPRNQRHQSIQIWLEHFTLHTANKDERFSMGRVTNLFAISALWSEVVAFFAVDICKVMLERKGLTVENSQIQIGGSLGGKRGIQYLDSVISGTVEMLWTHLY
ncbi:hypothetical protein JB92DRAFT_2830592 [Gautieria morchelliformis]|nr:hypothetical protein JB92DRAFT_2830592 [Gautieria morchelliformis]